MPAPSEDRNSRRARRFGVGRSGRRFGVLATLGVAAVTAAALLTAGPATADDAPGAPGIRAAWTTGGKQGLGTSATTTSKVWFTLSQGITNEIYYPDVETPDVQDLQYVISDGSTFTQLERDNTSHQVVLTDPKSLSYRQVNTAKNGRYRITKTYTTDPARPTVLIQTRFEVLTGGPLQLYVLYNPSLNNGGAGDRGQTDGGELVATDGPVTSALAVSTGFTKLTSGYSGSASDGFTDLSADNRLDNQYSTASSAGNIVQTAQIRSGPTPRSRWPWASAPTRPPRRPRRRRPWPPASPRSTPATATAGTATCRRWPRSRPA